MLMLEIGIDRSKWSNFSSTLLAYLNSIKDYQKVTLRSNENMLTINIEKTLNNEIIEHSKSENLLTVQVNAISFVNLKG